MAFVFDRMNEVYREACDKSFRGEPLTETELAVSAALGVVEGMQSIEERRLKISARVEGALTIPQAQKEKEKDKP